ncbi:hypothetical protein [Geodermatophilus amargosae]|uniref:hypothetical protein n=1 Tax=Geodermatophilus amargosae TaxID=1296565 RepID=UPI0034DEBA3A
MAELVARAAGSSSPSCSSSEARSSRRHVRGEAADRRPAPVLTSVLRAGPELERRVVRRWVERVVLQRETVLLETDGLTRQQPARR